MELPFKVIDADGHITENPELFELWASRMPERYRDLAPRTFTVPGGSRGFWAVEGKIWPAYRDRDWGMERPRKAPGMWVHRQGEHDPHARIPDMDYMQIDTAVLFCSTMVGVPAIVEDAGLATAICAVYNDWLAEYCAVNPSRLKGVAMLPVQDGQEAARELRRAVERLGLVGGLFPPFHGEKMLDNPHYFPIYEAAQELGVPICVHNNSGISPARHLFQNFILRHAYSTLPLMMSLGSIVMGGVLDRFPRLRFAFLEAGCGWAPYIMERVQERAELLPHWANHLSRTPEEYFRDERIFYSTEPEELTLPTAIQILGIGHFVIGSDYAHWDGTSPESVRMVLSREDISADNKKAILSDNPASLYQL